jgi:hypothetical protein
MVFTVGVTLLLIAAVVLRFAEISDGASEWLKAGYPFGKTRLGWWTLPLIPVLLYMFLVFIDSSIRNKSLVVGFLSIEAAFVQLFGYGLGFLKAWWQRCVLKKGEFAAYEKNFYE